MDAYTSYCYCLFISYIIIATACLLFVPLICLLSLSLSVGVSPPKASLLKMSDVYDETTGKPKHEVLKEHFSHEGRVEESVAMRIIKGGTTICCSFLLVHMQMYNVHINDSNNDHVVHCVLFHFLY